MGNEASTEAEQSATTEPPGPNDAAIEQAAKLSEKNVEQSAAAGKKIPASDLQEPVASEDDSLIAKHKSPVLSEQGEEVCLDFNDLVDHFPSPPRFPHLRSPSFDTSSIDPSRVSSFDAEDKQRSLAPRRSFDSYDPYESPLRAAARYGVIAPGQADTDHEAVEVVDVFRSPMEWDEFDKDVQPLLETLHDYRENSNSQQQPLISPSSHSLSPLSEAIASPSTRQQQGDSPLIEPGSTVDESEANYLTMDFFTPQDKPYDKDDSEHDRGLRIRSGSSSNHDVSNVGRREDAVDLGSDTDDVDLDASCAKAANTSESEVGPSFDALIADAENEFLALIGSSSIEASENNVASPQQEQEEQDAASINKDENDTRPVDISKAATDEFRRSEETASNYVSERRLSSESLSKNSHGERSASTTNIESPRTSISPSNWERSSRGTDADGGDDNDDAEEPVSSPLSENRSAVEQSSTEKEERTKPNVQNTLCASSSPFAADDASPKASTDENDLPKVRLPSSSMDSHSPQGSIPAKVSESDKSGVSVTDQSQAAGEDDSVAHSAKRDTLSSRVADFAILKPDSTLTQSRDDTDPVSQESPRSIDEESAAGEETGRTSTAELSSLKDKCDSQTQTSPQLFEKHHVSEGTESDSITKIASSGSSAPQTARLEETRGSLDSEKHLIDTSLGKAEAMENVAQSGEGSMFSEPAGVGNEPKGEPGFAVPSLTSSRVDPSQNASRVLQNQPEVQSKDALQKSRSRKPDFVLQLNDATTNETKQHAPIACHTQSELRKSSGEGAGFSSDIATDSEIDLLVSHAQEGNAGLRTPKPLQSTGVKDVFRRKDSSPSSSRGYQADVPSPYSSRSKKFDAGSVISSVSSTISPSSAGRGMLSSGGISPSENASYAYSYRLSTGSDRGGSLEAKPPLFPRKGRDFPDNPKKLIEFLSKKMSADEDSDAVDTRWIKQPRKREFDPNESIFARLDDSDSASLSPPGSPPEPVLDEEEDGSSLDEFDDETSSRYVPTGVQREATIWDMISQKHGVSDSFNDDDEGRPEYVVLPQIVTPSRGTVEDWGLSSLSELGVSARASIMHRSFVSDTSVSSRRRRGASKKLSTSSRGSGRRSVSSMASKRKLSSYKADLRPSIRAVRSEELPAVFSTKHSEELDELSVGGRSFSAELLRRRPTLDQKSVSSPDLRQLGDFVFGRSGKNVMATLELKQRRSLSQKATAQGAFADHSGSSELLLTDRSEILFRHNVSSESPRLRNSMNWSPGSCNRISSSKQVGKSVGPYEDYEDVVTAECPQNALLEQALVSFSSVERIEFPFMARRDSKALKYVASVRWRQLLANWKHSETMKALGKCYPSRHFDRRRDFGEEEYDPTVDTSTLGHRKHIAQLVLDGVKSSGQDSLDWKNLDGFEPQHGEASFTVLSRFLSTLGDTTSSSRSSHDLLRQVVSTQDESSFVDDLIRVAQSHSADFSSILEKMATFASEGRSRTFSIGVKDRHSIEKKAKRKYGGDVLQVKDVLRGQIIFPDEESLVYGILQLKQICKDSVDTTHDFASLKPEIVRIKNLFCSDSPLGLLSFSPLPTGYRHVLLNLRFSSGLVTEIQCHLISLFDVLGEEGFTLHRQISQLEEVLDRSTEAKRMTRRSKMDEAILRTIACHSEASCGSNCVTDETMPCMENNKTPLRSNTRTAVLKGDSHSTGPLSKAAAAATAAQKKAVDSVEEEESIPVSSGPLSIAAAAAAAAQKKEKPVDLTKEKESAPVSSGGPLSLAAAAAAAAQKRNEKADLAEEKEPAPVGSGPLSIAAAAATAAQKKNKEKERAVDPLEANEWTPVSSGGILSIAAAAAQKKAKDASEEKESPPVGRVVPDEAETPKTRGAIETPPNEFGSACLGSEQDGTREALTVEEASIEECISVEKTEELIECIRETAKDLTAVETLTALLGHGVFATRRNPRDVASFSCLNALSSFTLDAEESANILLFADNTARNADKLIDISRKCLLRCLTISNQATSTGMTGWFEYGASSPLGRVAERPFSCLHGLSCTYAREGRWDAAEDVLRALVSRCEQQLPLYHPTTLTALLDLAAVAMMNNRESLAGLILSRVADRLSYYLSETEESYLSYLDHSAKKGRPGEIRFVIGEGAESILMLTDFANLFQRHLEREMVTILGNDHETVLLHRSFLADSLSVLANCGDAAKASIGIPSGENFSRDGKYWRLAFVHYQAAFKGFSKTKGLDDPSTVAAAYGMARCLHALRETEKALELLSTVVNALEVSLATNKSRSPPPSKPAIVPQKDTSGVRHKSITFLPYTSTANLRAFDVDRQVSRALCFWLTAVLTANRCPGEEGRKESLNLLHGAWKSLQSALKDVSESDESSRDSCIELLRKIEDEAKAILEIQ